MLCPNCGQMNIGSTSICSNCGHPLTAANTEWQQPVNNIPGEQPSNAPDAVGIPPWTEGVVNNNEQPPYYGGQPENQWNQPPNQPDMGQQYGNPMQQGYQGGQFVPPPPPPGQYQYPPPQKSGRGKMIAIIVAIAIVLLILLLGIAGIGGYFILQKTSSDTTSVSDSSTSEDQPALYLDNVKTGYMDDYPDVEIGTAFDNFFSDPAWNYAYEDGWHKVIFTGGCLYNEKEVNTEIQFVFDAPITQNSSSFTIKTLKVDGEEMDDATLDALLEEIFSGTSTADPTSDIQEDAVNTDQLF